MVRMCRCGRYRLDKWAIWFLQPALRVSQPMEHAWKKIYADPAFAAWNAKGVASGLSSWVRSNVAREVSLA